MPQTVTMLENLGHYKILDQIGAGGLGEVYRARDTRVGRTVAIKVLPAAIAGTPERRDRFIEDARRATRLSHPNIAALYEVAAEPGEPLYLAYEFVEGQTLKALMGGRPLNPRRAVNLASQIADGLAEAHAADIAHGDLSADVIIVTSKGRAKILDVGLAAWATETPHGPEAPAAHLRDIADLGLLLFEMLTGSAPSPASQVSRVIVRAIPQELDPVVAKALGENGGYASVAALAGELRAVGALLDVRKEASDASAPPLVTTRPKPSWVAPTLVGLTLVVVLALAAFWYFRTCC